MTKQQFMLVESPLTKRVYVLTSCKDNGNDTFTARQKYDITKQFDALAKMRAKNGKVEIYIFKSQSGCRWCWDIWADKKFLCNGVEDTLDEAMNAVRKALELHKLIELEEVCDD